MKVPLSWLKEYVEFDASPEELAQKLTFSGSEVTGIEVVGSDYAGIVVGKVLEVNVHPGADRLRVCRVSDGARTINVVCGAENFEPGDKVPLALPGARLPNGMEITTCEIRGETSEGMLCAEDELGISEDHSGLLLLPKASAAGTPLSEILGPPETVLHLEITWNRGDCLSIIGMAREVAALCGGEFKVPPVDIEETGDPVEQWTQVTIEDPESCPRYTARVLSAVKLGPSPRWMQRRLSLCGVRPINNVVDITNYVMLECGQPLHAFDYELLSDHRIVVRPARAGECMATLDDVERTLRPDMLMIADAERPVAVAGIMGGAGSEIRDVTRTVLLESACFAPASIRKTSSVLGLTTESSHRFERGVDVEGVDWASRRAARLMVEHAGAVAGRGVVDVYPTPHSPTRVTCRLSRARSLLGMNIPDDEIIGLLESLQLPVVERADGICVVEAPPFRPDLCVEADLIEEVARLYGLERVPETIPKSRISPEADDTRTRAISACRATLVGLGLTETMNYSFTAPALLDRFGGPSDQRLVLPNPVSAEHSVMRDSLAPQMAETLARNLARQVTSAAFFELGKAFRVVEQKRRGEQDMLCVGLMGSAGRAGEIGRKAPDEEDVFLWLKGIVEQFLSSQHFRMVEFAPMTAPWMAPGWGISVSVGDTVIGSLGLLKQGIRQEWRMDEPVGIAELALEPVLAGVFALPDLQPVPAYPGIIRDIALIVNESVRHADIFETIQKVGPTELTRIELFDIFRSDGVGEGRKSMAYSLTYRSLDRTMTDEEANACHAVISDALKSELNAEIRES